MISYTSWKHPHRTVYADLTLFWDPFAFSSSAAHGISRLSASCPVRHAAMTSVPVYDPWYAGSSISIALSIFIEFIPYLDISPLLRHGGGDSWECFTSLFLAALAFKRVLCHQLSFFFVPPSAAAHPKPMRLYDLCRSQRRKIFQPKTRPFFPRLTILVRLDDLGIWRQMEVL